MTRTIESTRRLPRRTAIACSIALALALTGADLAEATFPGENGDRIAFSSDQSGDIEIYTMTPGGSRVTKLTNDPGTDSAPGWSPDGTKIVFASRRDGQREIYVMSADGSDQTRLTNNPADDARPNWSPDGSKIIFASTRDGTAPCPPDTTVLPPYHLFVMNADGSDVSELTPSGTYIDFQSVVSPDGTRVVFTRVQGCFPDDQRAIHVMNLDGTGLQQLTPWEMQAVEPDWSPSGQQIAFNDNTCPTCFIFANIWTMSADGSGMKQLTRDFGNNLRPAFSPAGDKITFTHDPSDSPGGGAPQDIYVMNVKGKGLKNLTNTPEADDIGSAWRPEPDDDGDND